MTTPSNTDQENTHFDVIIVGAGISGIGSAYHLQQQCPDKTFVILEAMESFGGTWLSHTYPGVRSDSDLHTFGYRFKPWTKPPIASGDQILHYLEEVIVDNELDDHIRYRHRIERANWNESEHVWEITARREETQDKITFTTNFLWMCQGYYRHSEGYTPDWPGMESYKGQIIHPQTWHDDIDLKDKQVLIIGSGATAATLVPAIANECAHLTMLQRSPTYFRPGKNANDLAEMLRGLEVDETWIHEIVRRKLLDDQHRFVKQSIENPEPLRQEMLGWVSDIIGPELTAKHFTPTYRPFQQRLAFVPDGDLFQSVLSGKVSIVTDHIETFTGEGVRLKSGDEVKADVIITATGFNMCINGDIEFTIGGVPIDFSDTVSYRGMMFTGVPNLIWVFGYFRASWTLRVDLLGDFVCRLLNHMKTRGADKVSVALRPEDERLPRLSFFDPEDFNPGYFLRGESLLPKRIDTPDWRHSQDYWSEKDVLPFVDLDDAVFVYESLLSGIST